MVNNSTIFQMDSLGFWTFQVGISLNINFLIINVNSSAGFAVDHHGNIGGYKSFGAGIGIGVDWGGGVSFAGSDGETISDLNGSSKNVSVTAGMLGQASIDVFAGKGTVGQNGFGSGFTLGFGDGADLAVTVNITKITPLNHKGAKYPVVPVASPTPFYQDPPITPILPSNSDPCPPYIGDVNTTLGGLV